MIYSIVAYGDPILRKKAQPITRDYPELSIIIENMFETMYAAGGVGLAAPQIGKSIRLFVVDTAPFAEEDPELKNFRKVFINPIMIQEKGQEWKFNEGCLSIPGIREDVLRKKNVLLRYCDEHFNEYEQEFSGLAARVIQHEYDHLEGILFPDRISPLRRQLIKGKLMDITKGKVNVNYKMKFPQKK